MTNNVDFENKSFNHLLKQVSEDEGLKEVSLEISTGSSPGDNYSGNIYRVRARGKKGSASVILNFIVKTCKNEGLRETIPMEVAYQRETFAYNTVLRELDKVQEETAVDPGLKFSFVKCYLTSDSYMEEMLVLEDLKVQGFIMYDRLKSTDYTHTSLVMMALGKLHALSYVLKTRKPRVFEELSSKCPDILCNGSLGKSFEGFFNANIDYFLTVLEDPNNRESARKFAEAAIERMRAATRVGDYGVLGHGDCWVNNVLFKYMDGVPIDIRLLDFQLMRYGSPALDILYFIFCCTDREFRSKHYFAMLDLYHISLTACLSEHSLDVNDFMSKKDFLQEMRDVADYGLGMAMLTLRIFASDSEDAPELSEMIKSKGEVKAPMPAGEGLSNGIHVINTIDDAKFEQFVNRIVLNISIPSTDIFTQQELAKLEKIFKTDESNVMFVIKTVHYLLKRMTKFVFKPVHLKSDLESLGFTEEKADLFVKVWAADTRTVMKDLAVDSIDQDKDSLNIKWQLSTELSSDVAKKSKVPKACISLSGRDPKSEIKMDLTHQELYGLFLQLESVQTELDNM